MRDAPAMSEPPVAPERRDLELDATTTVGYSVLGSSGPAILCSDLPLNPFSLFGPLQRTLSSQFRVYIIDVRPAIGASDRRPPSPELLEYCSGLVPQIAARLGLERYSIIGSFMFGAVAMDAARRAPSAVERLVLVNSLGTASLPVTAVMRFITGFYKLPVTPWMMRVPALRAFIEWFDQKLLSPIRMKELFAEPSAVPVTLEELYEHYKRPPIEYAGRALLWAIRSMRYDGLLARLGEVKAPSLLVVGQQDRWIHIDRQRALCAALPHASLVEVPGAMHAPEIEQTDAVAELVREFCAPAKLERAI